MLVQMVPVGSAPRQIRDVTARGVRMRVVEAGEGHPRAVVLLHDFLASHLQFDAIIDALASGAHVLAPDLPGFGESEKPSPARYAYGVDGFAEAIADVIAAYGLGRVDVVGHGLGGAIGITLAALHAELITRLALIAPLTYAHPLNRRLQPSLWPFVGGSMFKQLFGRRAFRAFYRHEVEHVSGRDAAFDPTPALDAMYAQFNTPAARESAYAVLRAMRDTRPVVARITRVRQPTLVMWGRQDRIYPAAFALKLCRELPDARLELFDAGHAPHARRPSELASVTREFFEGHR